MSNTPATQADGTPKHKPATTEALTPPYAAPSLVRRMSCFVYEGLLLFGLSLIPGIVGATWVARTGQPLQSQTALRLFAFVLYGLYFTWFWSGSRGQTLAMQTWQIRVVTVQGERLGRGRALARFFAACIWFAPAALLTTVLNWGPWQGLLGIGVGIVVYALLALLQRQHQFWHDMVCGTRLVAAPRRGPS